MHNIIRFLSYLRGRKVYVAVSGVAEKWLSPDSAEPECIRKIYFHIAEIVFPIPFADFSENPAGIAHSNRIGWNIPRHNAACANDRIVADGHARQNHTVSADPDIIADSDGQGIVRHHFPVERIYRVSGGAECHIGANHDLVADEDLTVIHQHQIEIGVEILTDMDMLAVGHMNRRLKKEMIAAASKDALHNGLALFILSGVGVVIFEHYFLAVVPLFLELLFLLNINGIGMAMLIEKHAAVDSVT